MKHEMLKTFLHRLKRNAEEGNIDWQYENYAIHRNKAEIKTFITEEDNNDPLEFMEVKVKRRFQGLKFELKIYPDNKFSIWRWQRNFDIIQEIFDLGKQQLNDSEDGIKKITKALE